VEKIEYEKNQNAIGNNNFIRLAGLLAILSTVGFALTLNNADRVFYAWAGLSATVLTGPAYLGAILEVEVYRSALGGMILTAINVGSTLTYGVGVLLLSLASRRTAMPRYFQWLGILSGTLGLFWIGFHWVPGFKDGEIGFWIPVVGLLLTLIWQVILGVYMLRSKIGYNPNRRLA